MMREPLLGELRYRVDISSVTTEQDANTGQPEAVETMIATRWAAIEELGQGERQEAATLQAHNDWVFTFRYYAALTKKHLLEWDGRRFEIQTVKSDGRKMWTWAIAREAL